MKPNVTGRFDPDVWHQPEGSQAIVRGNPWLDTFETLTPAMVIALESEGAALRAQVEALTAALAGRCEGCQEGWSFDVPIPGDGPGQAWHVVPSGGVRVCQLTGSQRAALAAKDGV